MNPNRLRGVAAAALLLVPALGQAEVAGVPRGIPMADTQCQMPREVRAERLAYLRGQLAETRPRLAAATARLNEYRSHREAMNTSYIWSDVSNLVASAAITYIFRGGIAEAFASGSLLQSSFQVTINGLPFLVTGYFLSFGADRIGEGHLDLNIVERWSALRRRGLDLAPAVEFLSSPEDTATPFIADLLGLEELVVDSTAWFEQIYAERTVNEPTWLMEKFNHHYGNLLGQVLVPYWRVMSDLFSRRFLYQQLLIDVLEHDQIACDQIMHQGRALGSIL